MTEGKIPYLIEQLTALDEKYFDMVTELINKILGTSLPNCLDCHRPMYPRKQWQKIPEEWRSKLRWITVKASYGRCATCYRNGVRLGTVETIRKSNPSILSDDELARLRKQVGLIK